MDGSEPSIFQLFLIGALSIYSIGGSIAAFIAVLQGAMSGESFASPEREEILAISREVKFFLWYPLKAFIAWPYYIWLWVKSFNETNAEDPDRSHLD